MEKDAKDFWFYAKLWHTKKDRLAYEALLHMRSTRNLSPKIYSRINSIEAQELEHQAGNIRSAPVT